MQNNLKVVIIQANLVWENPIQNRLNFTEKINQIKEQVDLIILPEMFTTGFSMQPQKIGDTMHGETVKWMRKIASEKDTAITGSVIIFENNNFYNRFLFVHPSGEINFYDKRHLFTLAGEDKVYESGKEKLIVNYKGWKICPLVCYDLRFPVWARNVEAYDLLIYVANWPKTRIAAWDTLLKARAIENMCYTIGVNRVGVDANNYEYNGHSAALNSLGEQVVETQEKQEETVVFTLDKNHISEIRNKLGFLNDRDIFEIECQ
ncbi:amidohydrolase [Lutibacter sp.]|uniref:amidohydrolase n=1 Tax=Lutibacter sp. TaxID=1925666 RepID=UPI0035622ECE